MKVPHSPAPWTVEINPDGDLLVLTEDAHSIYIGNLEGTCGTCHANARLIAAAPDLVAALEAVEWHPHTLYCPWCGMGKEDGHADDCQRQQALAQVKAE